MDFMKQALLKLAGPDDKSDPFAALNRPEAAPTEEEKKEEAERDAVAKPEKTKLPAATDDSPKLDKAPGAPNPLFHPIKALGSPVASITQHPVSAAAAAYAYPRAANTLLRGGEKTLELGSKAVSGTQRAAGAVARSFASPFKSDAPLMRAAGGLKNFGRGLMGGSAQTAAAETTEAAAQRLGYRSLSHMLGEAGSGPAASEMVGAGRAATAAGRAGSALSGGVGVSSLLGMGAGEAAAAAPLATAGLVAGAGAGGYAAGHYLNKALGGADYGSIKNEMGGVAEAAKSPGQSLKDMWSGAFGSSKTEVDKSKLGPGKTPAQIAAMRAATAQAAAPPKPNLRMTEDKSMSLMPAPGKTPTGGGMGSKPAEPAAPAEAKPKATEAPAKSPVGMGDVHKFEGKDEPAPLESAALAPEPQAPKEDLGGQSFGKPEFSARKQMGFSWGAAGDRLQFNPGKPQGLPFQAPKLPDLDFGSMGGSQTASAPGKSYENLRQMNERTLSDSKGKPS